MKGLIWAAFAALLFAGCAQASITDKLHGRWISDPILSEGYGFTNTVDFVSRDTFRLESGPGATADDRHYKITGDIFQLTVPSARQRIVFDDNNHFEMLCFSEQNKDCKGPMRFTRLAASR
jgi:hypothetical protein